MKKDTANASLLARKEAATPRGVGVMAPFFVARAENSELWDVEGRRFIDFAGGIAVLNTGHRHPRVVEAVRAQLDAFTHTAYQIVPYESYVSLAERLNALVPGPHPKKTTFFSTGAEAVENAVKIARYATGRSGVIAFSGAFHGRTMMGMALTGKVVPYKTGFGPFPGEVFHVPFPMPLHGVSVEDSLKALQNLFKADIEPKRVAAIIIEPVQGEGGFYVAPPELMRALRKVCDEHGILLIADEIQTGFGRTGKWFAMEHHDVAPDLMTMAKSLAGGFPLSAVTGRADVMDAPTPGGLGGTYAGSPMAIAAAHAVLDVMKEEKLVERAHRLGGELRERLLAQKARVPHMAEVRGLGAMLAVEFCQPGSDTPDPDFTQKVRARALERGLMLLTCGVYGNVIRFLFPLTIPDAVFAEALSILDDSLTA
ncbi:4-aminobutyrate--2-oxoglutarate transaminase [Myxococcus sp. RHSTA-1-4]|uniref:4-aminobutyrate--2-oxoglutarate transaminase n=1 Tax=Myxococcus sp. RHSTA-1-4 TaxID=2874601 RepID=UPI001CC15364|nr:4-aminobutyrate--2-oxoglutarate transaminase [Myxococcus sp. RHSTA-1-4]MBZ4422319.1 4-aminobutyrate--2-oxoglutarate transaminase [Myxococcus sp. RHSTA-1-4]